MKKIALISHCVLNNYCELPEASETFRKKILEILTDKNISIVQLPCPELCYQGLERESILPGTEPAEKYQEYCESLLAPIIKNLEDYTRHGIEIAGVVGIETSPSCSVEDSAAIMTRLLFKEMEEKKIPWGKVVDMPVSGDGKAFYEQLKQL